MFFQSILHLAMPAKEVPITAIALYDGHSGPAYIHITGLLLNGKTELRVCDGVPKIDKRTYDTLPRTQLTGATTLERGADGVLMLTSANAKPMCVVPSNLKFERNAEFTPSEAAEQATLLGTPVSSSVPNAGLPAFKPGMRLVLVAAPDDELAQFLIAQRANSIKGWQEFLGRYGSSA